MECKIIQEAVEKLKVEITKNNDVYVKLIGEYLIGIVGDDEEAASKVLVKDKSILGSIDAMSKEARKKAVNGRAMLTDEEGFEIVLKYYGIDKVSRNTGEAKVVNINEYKNNTGASGILDIDLDDILGDL